ncbi:hypothetical protein [Streptomyces wedmorensis]
MTTRPGSGSTRPASLCSTSPRAVTSPSWPPTPRAIRCSPPTTPHRDTSVRTVLNFYGTTDFDNVTVNPTAPGLIRQATQEYTSGTKTQHPDRRHASSPVHHVRPGLPPTLTIHGEDDRLIPVSQMHLLDKALADAGVQHRSVELPWSSHLFDLTRGNLVTQISAGVLEQFQQRYAH